MCAQSKPKYQLESNMIADSRGSIPQGGDDGMFFSAPPHPDRVWGLTNLLSNGYRGLLPRE